jgi:hypothetical protein
MIYTPDEKFITRELEHYDKLLIYFVTCDICGNVYKVIRKGKVLTEVDCGREDNQEG